MFSGKKRLFGALGALVVVAAIAGGGSFAMANAGDSEEPITGDALSKASAAALAHTGGGTVSETEVGDEDSYYEVEVTLDNGNQVDVQLDESFKVVGDEADSETEDESGSEDGND